MTNGEEAAMPCANDWAYQPGLTKREYIATHIMSGVAAYSEVGDIRQVAAYAVEWADALLKELRLPSVQ